METKRADVCLRVSAFIGLVLPGPVIAQDQAAGGSDAGTFQNPYRTLSRATAETPTGGTLWFLEPDDYSAVRTYSRAMTWRVGYGVVTLGN